MKHYTLQSDEVELYKALCQIHIDEISIPAQEVDAMEELQETLTAKKSGIFGLFKRGEDKVDKKAELESKYNDEVIITNYNLIFIERVKKGSSGERGETEAYSFDEIKVYNDKPYFKQQDKSVEIFFVGGEKVLNFPSKYEMFNFVNKAITVILGKGVLARATDKVKDSVEVVDNVLGIDSISTVKNIVLSVKDRGVARTVLQDNLIKKKQPIAEGNKNALGAGTNTIYIENTKSEASLFNDDLLDKQIQSLKKLKELLDTDIISKEEFEVKKAQVMKL